MNKKIAFFSTIFLENKKYIPGFFNSLVDQTYSLLGKHENKHPIQSEKLSRRNARRSIVLKKSIHIGAKINKNNIICKRPGIGISPIYWNKVIGSISKKILKEDHILKWSDIKKK